MVTMSSPIGHALVGLAFYTVARASGTVPRFSWAWVILFILLAGLPDFDMFLIWIFDVDKTVAHRTMAHSAFFAVAVGWLLAWLLAGQTPEKGRKWLYALFPLAILSHSLMDLCCVDLLPPRGVQWFWPFSNAYVYAPLPFMKSIGTYVMESNSTLMSILKAGVRELLIFGGLFLLVQGVLRLWAAFSRPVAEPES